MKQRIVGAACLVALVGAFAAASSSSRGMSPLQAVVLGAVEGITEFLPVSSTGHLILTERVLGIPQSREADAYLIAIQAGAILAVLSLYWARVAGVVRGLLGRDPAGLVLARNLLLAFLPAAAAGLLLEERIEEHLFGLWPVVAAWFVGGVALVLLRGRRGRAGPGLEAITPSNALWIGLAQALALWPGTSRSLVTIAAGLLVGLPLAAAVEFSFLLGVLTLTAAAGWKALHEGGAMLDAYGPATLLLGFLVAGITAALAVRWMVAFLRTRSLLPFGIYRISLAFVVTALLLAGVLSG